MKMTLIRPPPQKLNVSNISAVTDPISTKLWSKVPGMKNNNNNNNNITITTNNNNNTNNNTNNNYIDNISSINDLILT